MSPILVRPVREQLEHDRVIRLLQVKLKRKHEVIANIGEDQSTSIKIGQLQIYPDLVLTTADRGRKLMGTVEVETSESVNHLEARSQWAHLGRARAPFHLYVPLGSIDIARRLATENHVHVTELWSFHTIGDQTHFRLVQRTPEDTRRSSEPRGIVTSNRPEPPKPVAPPPPPRPAKAVAPPPPAAAKKRPPQPRRRAQTRGRRTSRPRSEWPHPRAKSRFPREARRRPARLPRHGPRKGSKPCRICGSIATSKATRTPSSSRANAGAGARGRACSTGSARRPA